MGKIKEYFGWGLTIYLSVVLANITVATLMRSLQPNPRPPAIPETVNLRPGPIAAVPNSGANPLVRVSDVPKVALCGSAQLKFCPGKFGMEAQACLMDNLADLPNECQAQIKINMRSWDICISEFQNFCKDIDIGTSKALICLRENVAKLTSGCRQRVL